MKLIKFSIILIACWIESVNSAEMACTGKVNMLMGDHPACADQDGKKQFAFKLENTEAWKCSGSDVASSLLLAARISGKVLSVSIDDAGGVTCSTHTNYLRPNYIILYGM